MKITAPPSHSFPPPFPPHPYPPSVILHLSHATPGPSRLCNCSSRRQSARTEKSNPILRGAWPGTVIAKRRSEEGYRPECLSAGR